MFKKKKKKKSSWLGCSELKLTLSALSIDCTRWIITEFKWTRFTLLQMRRNNETNSMMINILLQEDFLRRRHRSMFRLNEKLFDRFQYFHDFVDTQFYQDRNILQS